MAQDPRGAALLTPLLILYHRPGLGADFVRRFYSETEITLFETGARERIGWPQENFRSVISAARSIRRTKQGLPVEDILPDKLKEGGTFGGGGSSVLALINRAPHPNAARVFINWYLSRQGQRVWQNVMKRERSGSFGFNAHRYFQR